MLRIKINRFLEQLVKHYAKHLCDSWQTAKYPIRNLENLKANITGMRPDVPVDIKKYEDYIQQIIDHFDELVVLQPQDFEQKKAEWFNVLTEADLKVKFNNVAFHKKIIDALRYDDVKEKMRPYIERLGIRSCVYCNAQFAATYKNGGKEHKGHYEFDHNFEKSKYPFLGISFFNLVPCCANCNKNRLSNDVKFQLYITTEETKPFRFELSAGSIVEWYAFNDSECLEIKLLPNHPVEHPIGLWQNHQERFHIDELYAFFKLEAEHLIYQSKIYDKNNLQMLIASFGHIVTWSQAESIILGFDTCENQIHKAPLNMMRQDIAKQIGLL